MAALQEVTDLFSKLALHLTDTSPTNLHRRQPEEEQEGHSLESSISKLAQSLNLRESSRVRVLDTALSLMCFKAPQVFDSMIEYMVKTILSVLSASVNCKVLRDRKGEVLAIGSSISQGDCMELIEVFNDVAVKLECHGIPSYLLLCSIVRVAVSASCYRYLVPSMCMYDSRSIDGGSRSSAVLKLFSHLPKEVSVNNNEIPLRLSLWYLDPLALKNDILKVLQESMKRPFLSLSKEFYERMDWRSILICLVLSPNMFIYARELLHDFFLLTGLGSILELLIELIAMITDIISQPTWWGMSMELGSKLPFSEAYFPNKSYLLRLLAGSFSWENFLQLVEEISASLTPVMKEYGPNVRSSKGKAATVDHKSIWALAICFPDWFYFSSVLLYSDEGSEENFNVRTEVESKVGQKHGAQATVAAAKYIAWMLSPVNKCHQDQLFDSLIKVSTFWTKKQTNLCADEKQTAGQKKKLKKPKFYDKEDSPLGYNCQFMGLWLREFQSTMKCGSESVDNTASCEPKSFMYHNVLLRKIPLGILIGCPSYLSEDMCEMLLHYVSTGRIRELLVDKYTTMEFPTRNSEGSEELAMGSYVYTAKEAVAGSCLVFSLTDIVERISASLSANEGSGVDIIFQVKLRTGRYLIKCIKRIIQHKPDKDEALMLMDLQSRTERWRHQGSEVTQLHKDLDDVIIGLDRKLSSL